MIQKVIKIGSSAGVTIPRKQLKELGISIGDEVKVSLESTGPQPSTHDVEIYKLTQKLISRHKNALKNLADR
jgi:antitoxin component of MazEF toxin-antitoxin module